MRQKRKLDDIRISDVATNTLCGELTGCRSSSRLAISVRMWNIHGASAISHLHGVFLRIRAVKLRPKSECLDSIVRANASA